MSRLIIDVTVEQHQKIKVLAALQGKTIKDYVLGKLFSDDQASTGQSWEERTSLLINRIEEAENNPASQKTFEQLTQEIIQNRKSL